jgi:dihydroorotate dehydrogenase
MSLYEIIRSLLFRLDAEDVHGATLRALRLASATGIGRLVLKSIFAFEDKRLEVQAFGLTFRNPIGLASVTWRLAPSPTGRNRATRARGSSVFPKTPP